MERVRPVSHPARIFSSFHGTIRVYQWCTVTAAWHPSYVHHMFIICGLSGISVETIQTAQWFCTAFAPDQRQASKKTSSLHQTLPPAARA